MTRRLLYIAACIIILMPLSILKVFSQAWIAKHGLTGAQSGGVVSQAKHNMTAQQYQDAFTQFAGQGYKPVCIAGYTNGGEANYAAIWQKQASPQWYGRHAIPGNFY